MGPGEIDFTFRSETEMASLGFLHVAAGIGKVGGEHSSEPGDPSALLMESQAVFIDTALVG